MNYFFVVKAAKRRSVSVRSAFGQDGRKRSRRRSSEHMALAMAVQSSALKARLEQKAVGRPHKMMRKLYPDGTGAIGDVPKRRALGEAEDEEATEEFCAAVRTVANS
jgi:hypothetical protein